MTQLVEQGLGLLANPLACRNWNGQNEEFNDRDRRKQ